MDLQIRVYGSGFGVFGSLTTAVASPALPRAPPMPMLPSNAALSAIPMGSIPCGIAAVVGAS
jgi:hypothetical protein